MKPVLLQREKSIACQEQFNKNSRELFEELCDFHSCGEGRPSNQYVQQQVMQAYSQMLARWEEFAPMLRAIEKGAKVWERRFSVGRKDFTTKTIDDLLIQHNITSNGGATHSILMLPAGYASVETEDDDALLRFSEIYKAVQFGDKTITALDTNNKDKFTQKFDEKFYSTKKTDVTEIFKADAKEILAEVLLPWHAVARDEAAFGKMLGLLEVHHLEVYSFLENNFENKKEISKFIESYAQNSLEEDISAENLEEKVSTSFAKRISAPMVAGLMALAGGVVAMAKTAGAADTGGQTAEKTWAKTGSNAVIGEAVKNISYVDDIGSSRNGAIVYDSLHDKTLAIATLGSGGFGTEYEFKVWAFDFSTNSWSEKGTSPHIDGWLTSATYDSESAKVLVLAGSSGDSIWAYDYSHNSWEKKSDLELSVSSKIFSYDKPNDKVVLLSGGETWAYDYNTNNLVNKKTATSPSTDGGFLTRAVYDSNSQKHVLFKDFGSGKVGAWTYDFTANTWASKIGSGSQPQFNASKDSVYAAYDAQNDKTVMQIYHSNSNSFETWTYDVDNNAWAKQNPSAQISLPKPLTEWSGIEYDSSHNAIITTIASDAVYNSEEYAGSKNKETWVYSAAAQTPQQPLQTSHIVHLTDTHIGAKGDGDELRLQQTVSKILSWSQKPEYVVVSGDVADFGAGQEGVANYQKFLELVRPLENAGIKVLTVPGNHDYREKNDVLGSSPYVGGLESLFDTRLKNYNDAVGDRDISGKVIDGGKYVIIGLDSGHDILLESNYPITAPRGSGLKDNQVAWLENVLDNLDGVKNGKDASGKAKIIVMHHPGYNKVMLGQAGVINKNQDRFWSLIETYGADVVLAGHSHKNSYEIKDSVKHTQTASVAYEGTWRVIGVQKDGSSAHAMVYKPLVVGKTMTVRTGSPVDVQVVDSSGNAVALQASSVFAVDDKGSKQTEVSFDYRDGHKVRVVGTKDATSTSTYNLEIVVNSEDNSTPFVSGEKIGIDKGAVHEYSVSWNAIDSPRAVTVRVDTNGDGTFEKTMQQDKTITADEVASGKSNVPAQKKTPGFEGPSVTLGLAGAAYVMYRRRSENN